MAFYAEAFIALVNAHGIWPGEVAFRKTQVMNGIQQVGFTYTIPAADTDNAFGKIKLLVIVVFELQKCYGVKVEAQVLCLTFGVWD